MISNRQFPSLIWKFLPPGSKGEIFLRSIYHSINSNPIVANYYIKKAEKTYLKWKRNHDEKIRFLPPAKITAPSVTFILRCPPKQEPECIKTINTIMNQSMGEWKILIISYPELDVELFKDVHGDERIQICNENPINLKQIIDQTQTNYYLFCDSGDIFSEYYLKIFGLSHAENPGMDIYSTDVEILSNNGNRQKPFFKPREFSPEFLLTTNYLSRSLIKAELLQDEDDFPLEDFFDFEWDQMLKISKNGLKFLNIPYVTLGITGLLEASTKNKFDSNLLESLSDKKVSIIIPNLNSFQKVKRLLESIIEKTVEIEYEIILVDTGSIDKQILSFYEDFKKRKNCKVVYFKDEFNYSQAVNHGASFASSDLLLFMNNDMEVIHPDWLFELSKWASIKEVGIVGTKLLFPGGRIQHAGVVIGLQGFAGNVYRSAPSHYFGFTGSLDWTRNMSAVSGACHMMRREVYDSLDGYDPKFKIVFGDVDICLRAIQRGYRIVYSPGAELIHYEGRSRGFVTPVEDMKNGYARMESWMADGDPYFSPNLTYTTIPACDLSSDPDAAREKNIEQRMAALNLDQED